MFSGFFSTKSIKENKFEITGYLFDLHKLDGILKMRQKLPEFTLQMPNWSSQDLSDTELAVKKF